ncbi:MAG: DUF1638 domain-containing protein [Nitrospirae bacterium]|nr:DUF1638 domain-containing protein [Nitrospirota bacterium]
MTDDKGGEVVCLACSVFKDALDRLKELHHWTFDVYYFDSMLHMYPEKLATGVFSRVHKELSEGRKVVLLYGDCHPSISDLDKDKRFARVSGVNCYQVFFGKDRYRMMQREGTFFLLPEWATRWREVFRVHLGLEKESVAKAFMADFFKQIVYVDTGTAPFLSECVKEIEEFTGLPVRRLSIGLEYLYNGITDALSRLEQY